VPDLRFLAPSSPGVSPVQIHLPGVWLRKPLVSLWRWGATGFIICPEIDGVQK